MEMLEKLISSSFQGRPAADLKLIRYSACCAGVPRRSNDFALMPADNPVPR